MQVTRAEQQLASHVAPPLLHHCQQHTTSIEPKGKQTPESSSQTTTPRIFLRKRIVRFSRHATQAHSISRQDFSVQEINEVWYTKAEYTEIREEIRSTIKLLRAGLTDPERIGFCYRGLEHKTSERGKHRSLNIVESVESVLLQQKRMQLKGSRPNPRAIAKKYCAISLHCQNAAHRVGLWDAKFVERLWWIRADELPQMPRRRRSLGGLLRVGLTTDPEPAAAVGLVCSYDRGLIEHKESERGYKQRSPLTIVQSVGALLLQQKRMQLLNGSKVGDPRAISIASGYCAISLCCHNGADRVGLWDARRVELLWRVRADELPRMPRRKLGKR